ncbi:MAG: hypothetical protein A2Y87_02285 [Bacteroidetes bacterium RBG_13_46_8]|nr:MAG: hypothetical protein A2Y87_02285 [Bacteroidetes bacterium RBG_13_46_8]
MKKLLHEMIELLKNQVKHNLEIINRNEDVIRNLTGHPGSEEQIAAFQQYYMENKNLLAENNDFTNLQLTLIKFLAKYNHSELLNDPASLDEVDPRQDPGYVFELTVTGKIPFNPRHPFFESPDFFYQLMEHFEKTEQYEKCKELIEVKKVIR